MVNGFKLQKPPFLELPSPPPVPGNFLLKARVRYVDAVLRIPWRIHVRISSAENAPPVVMTRDAPVGTPWLL